MRLPCPTFSGVEALQAFYRTQSFAQHNHEAFAFGSPTGEAHTGQGADREGWSYRMFCVPPGAYARQVRT
ncbi:hypothetical protein [Aminomonas paucivorans]|uniref:hypothetical protein n=1 Tax=Aminomonas paucivorans TaxID=81412 RepID=UPI00332E5F72